LIPAPIRLLAFALLVGMYCGGPAEEANVPARERLDKIREQVRAAHGAKDAAAYLARSEEMQSLLNSSPNSVLQVMSAQAFGGDLDGALASFSRFIAMGQSNQAAFGAATFDALKKSERFSALEAEMRKNEAVVTASSEVVDIPEPGHIPEDIDYDPRTRKFYTTSILKHRVQFMDLAGHAATFADAPDPWPMLAVKVDARRRRLWVTEVALNGFASIPKADWKTSAILIYDVDSHHLLHRIAVAPHATLGDLALTPAGDAIVSDNDGALYRVSQATWAAERLDHGEFISPQTAAVSPDGKRAYVPDYLRGIAVVDLQTKHLSWLGVAGEHALSGIDGLYLTGDTLIAVQNGASPERVVAFELNPDRMAVHAERIIERATPSLGDPTHGVVVGKWFYYIANSGWDTLQDDGTPKPDATPARSKLMRAKINPAR